MRLRDLALDAPDVTPTKRATVRDHTRSTCALYERCLAPTRTPTAWKILLECVASKTRDDIQDLLGVLVYEVEYDVERFLARPLPEQKRETLEILQRGMLEVAERCNLATEPFVAAYDEVVRRGYANTFVWRKPLHDASRRRRAVVRCEHEPEYFRATLVIESREGVELASRVAFTAEPSEFVFVRRLGRLGWRGEAAVLEDDRGKVVCKLAAPRGG